MYPISVGNLLVKLLAILEQRPLRVPLTTKLVSQLYGIVTPERIELRFLDSTECFTSRPNLASKKEQSISSPSC